MRRWEDEKMGWWEDDMSRCEGDRMLRWECDMSRCEDVNMYHKPPLFEEPFAQVLGNWLICEKNASTWANVLTTYGASDELRLSILCFNQVVITLLACACMPAIEEYQNSSPHVANRTHTLLILSLSLSFLVNKTHRWVQLADRRC